MVCRQILPRPCIRAWRSLSSHTDGRFYPIDTDLGILSWRNADTYQCGGKRQRVQKFLIVARWSVGEISASLIETQLHYDRAA